MLQYIEPHSISYLYWVFYSEISILLCTLIWYRRFNTVLAGFKRINMFRGFNSASSNPINVRMSVRADSTISHFNFSTMNTKYSDFLAAFISTFFKFFLSAIEKKVLFFFQMKLNNILYNTHYIVYSLLNLVETENNFSFISLLNGLRFSL